MRYRENKYIAVKDMDGKRTYYVDVDKIAYIYDDVVTVDGEEVIKETIVLINGRFLEVNYCFDDFLLIGAGTLL